MTIDVEVAVLGAGYAGLAAADTLLASGTSVAIVEARDRVGGRTRTERYDDGIWLDLGGQWLGPGQDRMYALAARYGKRVFPMYVEGKNLLRIDGGNRTYRGLIPFCLSPHALASLGLAFFRLERLAASVPLDAPWKAKNAAALDAMTLGEWMRANIGAKHARELVKVGAESVFAEHPDDISLLHALFYFHAGGGLESLTSSRGGAQQDRVDGGLGGLATSYAADLRARGATFLFDAKVHAVVATERGVEVRTARDTVVARRVIQTMPPVLAAEVEYAPGLPDDRRDALVGLPPGAAMKCFAIYDRPFWRERGFSGSAVSDEAPVHVAFDVTPEGESRGILMAFLEGREARVWIMKSEAERRDAVLGAFTRFFGKEASTPLRYVEHEWTNDEHARGCYAGVAKPGYWMRVGSLLRTPHGPIHFAGTETATAWNGYVEGAVRSGERAAREVLAAGRS